MKMLVYLVYRLQECFQALVSTYGLWMFLTPAQGRGWECALVTPSQGFVPLGTVHGLEKKEAHSARYLVWRKGDPGNPVTPTYC